MALTNAITATASTIDRPVVGAMWTIRNVGDQVIYYRFADTGAAITLTTANFVETAAYDGTSTTITVTSAIFNKSMVGESLVITGVATFTVASYISGTSITVTGDASAGAGGTATFSMAFTGAAALLDNSADGILPPSGTAILRADCASIEAVCATGLSSSLEIAASQSVALGAGQLTPKWTTKVNPTVVNDGTSVGAVPLASASTPYVRATVTARTAGADAVTLSTANTNNVYICGAAEDLTAAIILAPGQSAELPPNCDLADFYLAVVTTTEGVLINYEV